MSYDYSFLYRGPEFSHIHGKCDAAVLATKLDQQEVRELERNQLLVAASAATAQLFSAFSAYDLGSEANVDGDLADACFAHWQVYLEAKAANRDPSLQLSDLVFFAAAGLVARRQVEVRSLLRGDFYRRFVDRVVAQPQQDQAWVVDCEEHVSAALICMIRQANKGDVESAIAFIRRLVELQSTHREKIEEVERQSDAFLVLSLYHMAHAVTRTSEYLLNGYLAPEDGRSSAIESELKRLLTKAEDLGEQSEQAEHLLWSKAVGAILWSSYSDSLWRQLGASSIIDGLLRELAARTNPVFSLLPSQRDAIGQHLLDRGQVAVVLQMPTSAGKTLLAEFSILQTFEAYKDQAKVLYLAPTRALCTQTFRTLSADFRGVDVPVQQASSAFEQDPFEASLISSLPRGVVVATPEKADLLMRTDPHWFSGVKLVVVDEAHLLSDKERGVRLELLLANIRREYPLARFLLLTPFVDNAKSVADWLGGDKSVPINVAWRPSRLMVGLAKFSSKSKKKTLEVEWREPHRSQSAPVPLKVEVPSDCVTQSAMDRVICLESRFRKLGLTLALFPSSKRFAEEGAKRAVRSIRGVRPTQPAEMRVAIALAETEYGQNSSLASCLSQGVAFHHASLSPELRFLVEDLARSGHIEFLAATTTLAQGINFPVASVLVHSVNKPFGGGDLTPSEFWNIAGRAGRVGLADKGFVVFANEKHRPQYERYSKYLSESIVSALLSVLQAASDAPSLKEAYRRLPQLRPFIQYLAHAAASLSPEGALATVEEIVEASFANASASGRDEKRLLRSVASRYLAEISGKSRGYLKVADSTGFGSFSFDEIFSKVRADAVLASGPDALLRGGPKALEHLVQMLAWLPELELALGKGSGLIDSHAVARVVQAWMDGKTVQQIATEFSGDAAEQVRKAGAYVFSKVSQTISWGAHAYIKDGCSSRTNKPVEFLLS